VVISLVAEQVQLYGHQTQQQQQAVLVVVAQVEQ
jgi:hypothetical protein